MAIVDLKPSDLPASPYPLFRRSASAHDRALVEKWRGRIEAALRATGHLAAADMRDMGLVVSQLVLLRISSKLSPPPPWVLRSLPPLGLGPTSCS